MSNEKPDGNKLKELREIFEFDISTISSTKEKLQETKNTLISALISIYIVVISSTGFISFSQLNQVIGGLLFIVTVWIFYWFLWSFLPYPEIKKAYNVLKTKQTLNNIDMEKTKWRFDMLKIPQYPGYMFLFILFCLVAISIIPHIYEDVSIKVINNDFFSWATLFIFSIVNFVGLQKADIVFKLGENYPKFNKMGVHTTPKLFLIVNGGLAVTTSLIALFTSVLSMNMLHKYWITINLPPIFVIMVLLMQLITTYFFWRFFDIDTKIRVCNYKISKLSELRQKIINGDQNDYEQIKKEYESIIPNEIIH